MQLSKNLSLEEMERSQTAQRMGIKNKAGSGEIKNLTDLCYNVLEPCRAKFDKPIRNSSGYRSEDLCVAIHLIYLYKLELVSFDCFAIL